jgi:hypothetical protein
MPRGTLVRAIVPVTDLNENQNCIGFARVCKRLIDRKLLFGFSSDPKEIGQ